jgi:hypothetical protein
MRAFLQDIKNHYTNFPFLGGWFRTPLKVSRIKAITYATVTPTASTQVINIPNTVIANGDLIIINIAYRSSIVGEISDTPTAPGYKGQYIWDGFGYGATLNMSDDRIWIQNFYKISSGGEASTLTITHTASPSTLSPQCYVAVYVLELVGRAPINYSDTGEDMSLNASGSTNFICGVYGNNSFDGGNPSLANTVAPPASADTYKGQTQLLFASTNGEILGFFYNIVPARQVVVDGTYFLPTFLMNEAPVNLFQASIYAGGPFAA